MPTSTGSAPANANANLSLSENGQRALQQNEGLRHVYYNDSARNCTYGVGTLAHMGPCTARELGQPVPGSAIQAQLGTGVRRAEQIVRDAVPDHALTQEQFDAAVSFAYNVPGGARAALSPANRGDMAAVARNMNGYVYVHAHDTRGRPVGPSRRSDGLVTRRRREAAPFLAPPAAASEATPATAPTAATGPTQ
ncbi:lysozyme [Paraburkholderia caribensis]|uniref:lysozyme n=1 Tax=Paraburkholderia caribensis TaxID=75105 RepID=UPI001D07B6A6|nr:lysozyme [Paraburkholderia caribensis]